MHDKREPLEQSVACVSVACHHHHRHPFELLAAPSRSFDFSIQTVTGTRHSSIHIKKSQAYHQLLFVLLGLKHLD